MATLRRLVLMVVAAVVLSLGILQLSAGPAVAYADCTTNCNICCPPEQYYQCTVCCRDPGPGPKNCCCY